MGGRRFASWSRRGFDTVARSVDPVLARLTRGLEEGDVLLLHDGSCGRDRSSGRPVVLEVLPRLLDLLAARSLRAVPLELPAPS